MSMMRVCELVESELDKIADRGLTSGNIETAYKLVDMYKDLKEAENMMGGYSNRGYSNADRMPRYDEAGSSYGRGRMYSNDSGVRNLDEYLTDYTSKIENMYKESRPEEREVIKRHLDKLKSM